MLNFAVSIFVNDCYILRIVLFDCIGNLYAVLRSGLVPCYSSCGHRTIERGQDCPSKSNVKPLCQGVWKMAVAICYILNPCRMVYLQENYLNYRPSGAGRDDNGVERMDLATRAATSIADGDVVNVQIRRFRQWQHAQMGAFMSSIIPYVVSTLSESIVWDPTNLKKWL